MKNLRKTSSQRSFKLNDEDTISVKSNFREKCEECLKGPKQIIRSIVLLTCTIVVLYQIVECFKKIQNPPTTTYTHFDFNESIQYPAITLCRDPAYRYDVMKKYDMFQHPRVTSNWRSFPFDSLTLDDFWEEVTYDKTENLIGYSLNRTADNILVEDTIHFTHGKCQTLYPKIQLTLTNKDTGYSIRLNHSLSDIINSTSTVPPGYHVFIHQSNEKYAEGATGALVDYLYLSVGEEMEVKLELQEVNMLVGGPKSCETKKRYTLSQCLDQCKQDYLEPNINCSGPWLKINDLPRCNSYNSMKDLVVKFTRMNENSLITCPCLQPCRFRVYSSNVVDRNHISTWNAKTQSYTLKSDGVQSHLHIYFNTKTVFVYEEKHGYDWSLFLADFGGSLGFLLGLSVLGTITLLESLYDTFLKPIIPGSTKEEPRYEDDFKNGRKISHSNKQRKSGEEINNLDSISSGYYGDNKVDLKDKNFNFYHDAKYFDKNFYI